MPFPVPAARDQGGAEVPDAEYFDGEAKGVDPVPEPREGELAVLETAVDVDQGFSRVAVVGGADPGPGAEASAVGAFLILRERKRAKTPRRHDLVSELIDMMKP